MAQLRPCILPLFLRLYYPFLTGSRGKVRVACTVMKHLEAAGTFSTQASVRSYESGPDGLMKPETVLHWLQEIAEAHASTLGFGYDFVMSRGLAWVEVRLDMAIRRLSLIHI